MLCFAFCSCPSITPNPLCKVPAAISIPVLAPVDVISTAFSLTLTVVIPTNPKIFRNIGPNVLPNQSLTSAKLENKLTPKKDRMAKITNSLVQPILLKNPTTLFPIDGGSDIGIDNDFKLGLSVIIISLSIVYKLISYFNIDNLYINELS